MEIFLKLDNFEGPLDLLLTLIEKKKLSISQISIHQLIDEYLEIVNREKEETAMEIKADFLVIASELIEIKTLSLLKLDENQEKEKQFIRRLEDYKILKGAIKKIAPLENEYRISYTRGEAIREIKKVKRDYDLSDLSTKDIYDSLSKYIQKKESVFNLNFEKKYSLEDEMDNIYLKIVNSNKTYDEIFETAKDRMHLIYMFLAILELYKDGKIVIGNGNIKRTYNI